MWDGLLHVHWEVPHEAELQATWHPNGLGLPLLAHGLVLLSVVTWSPLGLEPGPRLCVKCSPH
jgi:hypothetical protein